MRSLFGNILPQWPRVGRDPSAARPAEGSFLASGINSRLPEREGETVEDELGLPVHDAAPGCSKSGRNANTAVVWCRQPAPSFAVSSNVRSPPARAQDNTSADPAMRSNHTLRGTRKCDRLPARDNLLDEAMAGTRVLITNDDGVDSPGIHALARHVEQAGYEVLVVAPDHDASGTGAALGRISPDHPIALTETSIDGLAARVYAIGGPPALCVMAGESRSLRPPPGHCHLGYQRRAEHRQGRAAQRDHRRCSGGAEFRPSRALCKLGLIGNMALGRPPPNSLSRCSPPSSTVPTEGFLISTCPASRGRRSGASCGPGLPPSTAFAE